MSHTSKRRPRPVRARRARPAAAGNRPAPRRAPPRRSSGSVRRRSPTAGRTSPAGAGFPRHCAGRARRCRGPGRGGRLKGGRSTRRRDTGLWAARDAARSNSLGRCWGAIAVPGFSTTTLTSPSLDVSNSTRTVRPISMADGVGQWIAQGPLQRQRVGRDLGVSLQRQCDAALLRLAQMVDKFDCDSGAGRNPLAWRRLDPGLRRDDGKGG